MKLSLVSWNSNNINSGAFRSYIQRGQLANLIRSVVIVNRSNDYPSLSGIVEQGSVIVIGVLIGDGYDINTYRETLKGYFFGDKARHSLIAQDENDSNKQYYRSGFATRLVQESERTENSFYVTIQTDYPYWELVTPSSDSWDITASGDSTVITNGGNLPIQPVLTITPTTTKAGGYQYWRYVSIYNTLDNAVTLPLDVTDGGLDVQALVDANKMQASGNDFRIWNNGKFADRWLYGMDTDSDPAKCWSNISLTEDKQAAINAAVDSDDTTLSFSVTEDNLSFLSFLKSSPNFTLLIDSEAVVFDPSNIDTVNYQITGITRAQKNTIADSHSSSSIVRYIPNDLFILYGDSDATAPDVNDNYKPIFDLSSTNQSWQYTNYFDTSAKNRPGTWKPERKSSRTGLSYYFTSTENAFVNPATVMGLAEVNSADFTAGHETATIAWTFSHPSGITNVAYSGEKYRTNSWPGIVGLQKLQDNLAWFTVENEAQPTVSSTWEVFAGRSETLSGTYNNIRFIIEGTLSSTYDERAMVQVDSVDLDFDSDNIPVISVGSETSINFFNIKLTNSTTGEFIKITTPCPVNSSLIVDCVNRKAYLADGRQVPVTLSSERDDWFNLASGNNSIVYEDTGTAGVTIVISHRDKIL